MKAILAASRAILLGGAISQSCVRAEGEKDTEPVKAEPEHKHTNRLIHEKSPYLLQHAHNPVDWHPWGDEAFELARKLNKPVLLSIGYSTCHWCHVMERESFENEEIAAVMNKHFVCIKLDREERPDVDKIYITAVQALTGGSAGWPLNVFLTPDRKPFFGGTYFPPRAAPGRPAWPDLCERIAEVWKEKQEAVLADADNISRQLAELMNDEGGGGALEAKELENALARFKAGYDAEHGGWGGAPKFPRPGHPRFMLQAADRFGDPDAVKQVAHTCREMAAGGMYDQLGGGFCRYSVDAEWLVPHFEKMLYDNAQLVHLYLDAYLVEGREEHAAVVRDILRYVFRDMTHPEGGFYSAEDADSEGKEGKFYCWTKAELEKLLTKEEFELVVRRFGITGKGNFVDHSDPEPLLNQNVLSIVDPELNEGETATLTTATAKMMKERDTRVRPGLDDKVLTSWNGLMLGAVARASAVLGNDDYLAAAEKNLAFIRSKMWEDGKLYHRWRDGERDEVQLFATYAYFLDGVLELYGVTLKPEYLQFAIELADRMISAFYDEERGGFFQASGAKDLIMRVKDDYDGAEPSGNSVAVGALLKLAAITESERYRAVADQTLAYFGRRLKAAPETMPVMLMAAEFAGAEPKRVVISGLPDSAGTRALIRAAHSVYRPNKVVLGTAGPVEEFATTLAVEAGEKSQAYVCTGKHCELPTASAAKVRELLGKKG